MRSTFALRTFSGKNILYLQAGKICGSSPFAFSREGHNRERYFHRKSCHLEPKKPAARRNVLTAGRIDNRGTLIKLRC